MFHENLVENIYSWWHFEKFSFETFSLEKLDGINWDPTTQFKTDFHNPSYLKLTASKYSKLCSKNSGTVLIAIVSRSKWNGFAHYETGMSGFNLCHSTYVLHSHGLEVSHAVSIYIPTAKTQLLGHISMPRSLGNCGLNSVHGNRRRLIRLANWASTTTSWTDLMRE